MDSSTWADSGSQAVLMRINVVSTAAATCTASSRQGDLVQEGDCRERGQRDLAGGLEYAHEDRRPQRNRPVGDLRQAGDRGGQRDDRGSP